MLMLYDSRLGECWKHLSYGASTQLRKDGGIHLSPVRELAYGALLGHLKSPPNCSGPPDIQAQSSWLRRSGSPMASISTIFPSPIVKLIAYCGDAIGRGAPLPIPAIPIAIFDARCGRGELAEGASFQAQRTHGEILEQRIVEEDVLRLLVRRGCGVP